MGTRDSSVSVEPSVESRATATRNELGRRYPDQDEKDDHNAGHAPRRDGPTTPRYGPLDEVCHNLPTVTHDDATAEARRRQTADPESTWIATQRDGEWVVARIGLQPQARADRHGDQATASHPARDAAVRTSARRHAVRHRLALAPPPPGPAPAACSARPHRQLALVNALRGGSGGLRTGASSSRFPPCWRPALPHCVERGRPCKVGRFPGDELSRLLSRSTGDRGSEDAPTERSTRPPPLPLRPAPTPGQQRGAPPASQQNDPGVDRDRHPRQCNRRGPRTRGHNGRGHHQRACDRHQ